MNADRVVCPCGICREDCTYHKPATPTLGPKKGGHDGMNWSGMGPFAAQEFINKAYRAGHITMDEHQRAFDAFYAGKDSVSFLQQETYIQSMAEMLKRVYPQKAMPHLPSDPNARMQALGEAWRAGRISPDEANFEQKDQYGRIHSFRIKL